MVPDGASTDDQHRSRQAPPPLLPSRYRNCPVLPQRLAAERPGWIREVDIVVIGSGIAGFDRCPGVPGSRHDHGRHQR